MSGRRWYWPRLLLRQGAFAIYFAPTFAAIGVGFYPEIPGERHAALSGGFWPFLVTFDANPNWYADAAVMRSAASAAVSRPGDAR